jgi:hypothetical protein
MLSVYPNPVAESITVMATAAESGTCTITIKDITGRTVATQSAKLNTGMNQVQINGLNSLSPGTYKVLADINGRIETTTLVK